MLQSVRAARAFSAGRFVPFEASGRVGWIRRDRVAQLARWPGIFAIDGQSVRVRSGLASAADRTAALAEVVRALANEGEISGWRHETYAVRAQPQDAPLLHIERAAMRFFGLTSQAAHLNGFVRGESGLQMWIARRSASKSIDPGLLDTLVGGGIPSGQNARQTLIRECFEEAGIEPALAKQAKPAGVLEVCHEVPQGLHSEILHAHDLQVPTDFRPRNVDGEVAEFHCLAAADVADRIASGEFTVEAGLVTLDFLLRHAAIEPDGQLHSALDECRVRP
jgi:8-oxo-dGTP pyrophosphatase MutT (NUDIX family)